MSMLKQLVALDEAIKVGKIKYGKKKAKSSTTFKKVGKVKTPKRKILHDSAQIKESQQLADLQAKLKELQLMLADMPSNPGNQEGYDARDDIRWEIDDVKKQIANLTAGAPVTEARVNVPSVVDFLAKFKDRIQTLPEAEAKELIRKQTKMYFYHTIWSIDKDEWDNKMDDSQKNGFVDAVYRRVMSNG